MSGVFHWDRRVGAQARLLLAFKAAIAAGLAWLVAQAVPGAAAHYPYYAPLGAVIATGPTVLHGIREGLRTLVGLAVGIALGLAVIAIGGPHYLTVPIAVAVAVLAAGFRFVGQANTWVATAAIFVLLIGGTDPTDYSIGYLVQMLVGAAVGVGVNMLLFPPLAVRDADSELRTVQHHLADHLERLGKALDNDDIDAGSWATRLDELQAEAVSARAAVRRADESRRGNPRAARRNVLDEVDTDYHRLRSLERALFALTDLIDIVARASPVTEPFGGLDHDLVPAFSDALRRVADAVRPSNAGADDHEQAAGDDVRDVAEQTLIELQRELDKQGTARPSEIPMSTAATVALRNVFAAVSQSQRTDSPP
jgi:hypothetical protein